jgi:hypothetical protein
MDPLDPRECAGGHTEDKLLLAASTVGWVFWRCHKPSDLKTYNRFTSLGYVCIIIIMIIYTYVYICIYIMCIYIYIYMYILQMGTMRGYSVNNPRNISRDYSPTQRWLKCPNTRKINRASVACHWNAGKRKTQGILKRVELHPEQGSFCSHIHIYVYTYINTQ